MKRPRIYADFNKWDASSEMRWVILTAQGSKNDLAKQGPFLKEGLEVTFYSDDADEHGEPDELQVDGVVRFDVMANHWIGVFDWNHFRHASDTKD